MKTIITAIVLSIISISVQGQVTPPATPEPPATSSSSYTSSSISHSTSYSSDNKKRRSSSSSISINNTSDMYKFRARYAKELTTELKEILNDELGVKNKKEEGIITWSKVKNGEKAFYCKLAKGSLKIYVDKELVSDDFAEKIEMLGQELRNVISG